MIRSHHRAAYEHLYHHEGSWAVGRYRSSAGRSRFSSTPRWHLLSGCRRPRLAARGRALQHRQRSCPCRLGHIDPRLRPTASDTRGAHSRYTRERPRRLNHVSRGAREGGEGARLVSTLVRSENRFHEAKAVLGTDDLAARDGSGTRGRPGSQHTSSQERRRSRRQAPELTRMSPGDSLGADFN